MTTLNPTDDRANSLQQEAEHDAEPIYCVGCDLDVTDSPNNIRRTDGNGNWHTFCSEDCYRDWCEDTAWRYMRLVDELNKQFRRVEQEAQKAQDVRLGHWDEKLLKDYPPEKHNSVRWPTRSGTIYAMLTTMVQHCRRLGDGRPDINPPMDPDLKGGA